MFENYSFGDLLSNIYKKRILNFFVFVILSCLISGLLVIKTINKKTVVKEGVQYSSYILYKITAPKSDDPKPLYDKSGYSEFFVKLLESNLNGAYLFNDVDDKVLDRMSKELSTSTVTLKNSNFDYWDKKVVVNYISSNLGVSVKIFTPSKLVNDEIEKKFDMLIENYKNVYKGVKVDKLNSNYSKELISKENINRNYSLKKLLVKVFAVEVVILIFITILNFILYIFNPTINREGDYSKYNLKFVQEVNSIEDILAFLSYRISIDNLKKVYILSSNSKIISKIKLDNTDKIEIIKENEFKNLLDKENFVFLEEYGISRYSSFEKMLQKLKNLDKNILGVITFKL